MSSPKDQHGQSGFRPSAREVLTTWQHFLAFGFGSGLAPKGPGTAGTLAAVPIWFALAHLPTAYYLGLVLVLFVFGCWVCGDSARRLGVHDYGGIVFDEIVGYLITCIPLLPGFAPPGGTHPAWTLLAFVFFRIFDIWKPWPIRAIDRGVGGGFGIMIDDVIAAVYAAALLEVAIWSASR